MSKNFIDFCKTELNEQQYIAATKKEGVYLVCAGAGSGKTRVITARIAHLMLVHHVPADQIIAVTFTNKAAREMLERVKQFIGHDQPVPFIGTFHSYCLRLLKTHARLLALDNFSILDDDDQQKLIKTIITRHGVHKTVTARAVGSLISHAKNSGGDPLHYFADPLMRELYTLYEKEKSAAHLFDFDDLLYKTKDLFKNSAFCAQLQSRVRHVLVDEYQDTNVIQHELLRLIATNDTQFVLDSLCAVGDEDQAIYSWRGATISNIINFHKDFPAAERITIEHNYRSVQPILDAANAVIIHNRQRHPKNLKAQRAGNDRVISLACASGYQEADLIALIARLQHERQKLSTTAVLYRSHHQSRIIEDALIRHAIPYKIIGGVQFYERQEIKDLLAYLKLIVNPFDRVSLARILNVPTRGLGAQCEEQFFALWDQQPLCHFLQVAQQLHDNSALTAAKKKSLAQFIKIFENLSEKDSPSHALKTVIERTQYITYLRDGCDTEEFRTRNDNVAELISAVTSIEIAAEHQVHTVAEFLETVALMQDAIAKKGEATGEYISLMSLHSAKGLEFNTVILAGLDEGLFPSTHSISNPEAVEEERRLMYVGITRARERLIIMHARYRTIFGKQSEQRTSRFIKEMGKTIRIIEAGYSTLFQITAELRAWLAGSRMSTTMPATNQSLKRKHLHE